MLKYWAEVKMMMSKQFNSLIRIQYTNNNSISEYNNILCHTNEFLFTVALGIYLPKYPFL